MNIRPAVYLLFLASSPAWAGGLFLNQVGTPDMGTAAAGWAARAQDAATVFTNPAGMTRLDRDEAMAGAQLLYADIEFSPDANTTPTGNDGGNPVGLFPGGSAFYVHSIDPNLKVGIGLVGNFGLSASYSDTWVGRYYVQNATLIGASILPSIAYRINDHLSVGASLNAMYSMFSTEIAINNLGTTDGQLKLDDNEWGFGANVGVLYEINKGTRLGLTYTSEVDLDFSDTPKFKNLGPINTILLTRLQNIDLGFTVPQTLMGSFYHDIDDRWTVLGNLGWQDWSKFGYIDVKVTAAGTLSTTVDAKMDDTWHAALGAQYKKSDAWRYSFGMSYDSSAVDDKNRTVVLPLDEQWTFGVGGQYHRSDDMEIGLAYNFVWSGDMSVNQSRGPLAGTVSGDYDNTASHFFTINALWRF